MASTCVLALALTGGTALSAQAFGRPARAAVPVLGYQEAGSSTSLITASAAGLDSVGVDGVNINSSGSSVDTPDSEATAQLARAHALGKPTQLLFGNFVGDDFSEPAAYRLLSSSSRISTVTGRLASIVRSQGWDGVQVDLESLQQRDTSGLVTFLKALRTALPSGKSISIALMLFDTPGDYASGGYDLASIGSVVDRVVLMAYDQHGGDPESGAGPIGALDWQTGGLDALLTKVPAAKVDLGVAGYGARWSSRGVQLAWQVSDAEARRLAGSRAVYDTTAKEWTAKLSDGSVLWWSDARSLTDRRALVAARGLHGMAVWSLTTSDPIQP